MHRLILMIHNLCNITRDVHETFLAEAEAETEAFWPETEARPRRLSTCPRRRPRPRPRLSATEARPRPRLITRKCAFLN